MITMAMMMVTMTMMSMTRLSGFSHRQPRSQALSPFPPLSSRRETLVAGGHVSMYTNQSRTRGGSSTKFFNRTIQFCLGEGNSSCFQASCFALGFRSHRVYSFLAPSSAFEARLVGKSIVFCLQISLLSADYGTLF